MRSRLASPSDTDGPQRVPPWPHGHAAGQQWSSGRIRRPAPLMPPVAREALRPPHSTTLTAPFFRQTPSSCRIHLVVVVGRLLVAAPGHDRRYSPAAPPLSNEKRARAPFGRTNVFARIGRICALVLFLDQCAVHDDRIACMGIGMQRLSGSMKLRLGLDLRQIQKQADAVNRRRKKDVQGNF